MFNFAGFVPGWLEALGIGNGLIKRSFLMSPEKSVFDFLPKGTKSKALLARAFLASLLDDDDDGVFLSLSKSSILTESEVGAGVEFAERDAGLEMVGTGVGTGGGGGVGGGGASRPSNLSKRNIHFVLKAYVFKLLLTNNVWYYCLRHFALNSG